MSPPRAAFHRAAGGAPPRAACRAPYPRPIGDILIPPTNPDIAWVAALGHAWGPNEERGVFKTTDGGKTWRKVLYKSSKAGAVDLAMDPHYPDVLYATVWQAQRHPHMLWSGGEDSGLWK